MNNINTIFIKDLIGENCITIDDGQQLYDSIHSKLLVGEHVELDFNGVEICASPFFNFGIGQLLKDLSGDRLNQLLTVSHLHRSGLKALKVVIDNSKQYYSSESVRQAIDSALDREVINQ
jgi:STAS-like domain of unknown function (DUF4325)